MKFFCGDYFKFYCKYSVPDYTGPHSHVFKFKIHPNGSPSRFFIKTSYLNHFFSNFEVKHDYTLITHNDDLNITADIAEPIFGVHPHIRNWYAQNVNYRHPRLHPIPIGIANPKWEHGNQSELERVQNLPFQKNNLTYVNFDIYTNPRERQLCLDSIGLPMEERVPFGEHLEKLSRSYFCVSPNGNGLDCHRHWECLYLKTVPIVTRSTFTELLLEKGIPLLIIEDWSKFKELDLSPSLYQSIWGNFDPETLHSLFQLSND